MEALKNKKLYVLDMDGTIYLGSRLFPETIPFLERVKAHGKQYIFFTNNSSRSPQTYVQRLNNMGIAATREDIVTSGDVMIHFLKTHRSGKTVYLLGTPDLVKSFEEAGIPLVQENPDIVLLGFDTTLTYEKLDRACHYLRNGAEFLCTHEDINCPTEYGFMPDAGAMCALITASTGVKPRFTGKPHVEVLEILEAKTGISREDMVAVGDRLYTDIALGANNGAASVLVLSGETTLEDLEKSTVKPMVTLQNIGELETEA
ncbi:MAG: HAD-IIA family hydrolase [Firmicutes bacterium]|nr:HAD-IIA family hydrolase [Bacillota bacterium]